MTAVEELYYVRMLYIPVEEYILVLPLSAARRHTQTSKLPCMQSTDMFAMQGLLILKTSCPQKHEAMAQQAECLACCLQSLQGLLIPCMQGVQACNARSAY